MQLPPGPRRDGDGDEPPLRFRGDEADLYLAFNPELKTVIGKLVRGIGQADIEDACGFAWIQFFRYQPSREQQSWKGWLVKTAQREAWKLSARRRDDRTIQPIEEGEGAGLRGRAGRSARSAAGADRVPGGDGRATKAPREHAAGGPGAVAGAQAAGRRRHSGRQSPAREPSVGQRVVAGQRAGGAAGTCTSGRWRRLAPRGCGSSRTSRRSGYEQRSAGRSRATAATAQRSWRGAERPWRSTTTAASTAGRRRTTRSARGRRTCRPVARMIEPTALSRRSARNALALAWRAARTLRGDNSRAVAPT